MAKYTAEKNILMLITLLKQHGVKNIIASPGTTNISFVASVQSDPFFKVISCVDERSAAYIACGIAAETGEPVVLTCTGATASRNYAPGLTEAFYRKLPIIAVTATQHLGRVANNMPQVLDRSQQFADMVKKSVQLYEVHTDEDAWACNLAINDAILEAKHHDGGPVHINMVTTYNNTFTSDEPKPVRMIRRTTTADELPEIPAKNVAIFIGEHAKIGAELTKEIEEFCEKYNAVVLCDHTSKYDGKYKIIPNLITMQGSGNQLKNLEFTIDLGNVSGIYANLESANTWRVHPDGKVCDTFKTLTRIFEMSELEFFKAYNAKKTDNADTSYYETWQSKYNTLEEKLSQLDLPFSNLWIAGATSKKLDKSDRAHIAILNTLRSWNLTGAHCEAQFYSNTGGFGIDGNLSSAFGDSLVIDDKVYCFIGDLSFFYDMNAIGNKNLKSNLRVLLVNNGCGTEFHNYNHRAVAVSRQNGLSSEFFAADGHFGNKSRDLVKHYTEDLGFEYMSASNKEEFLANVDKFTRDKADKPLFFEVFTDEANESKALEMVYDLEKSPKSIAKKILGEKGQKIVKKMLGK